MIADLSFICSCGIISLNVYLSAGAEIKLPSAFNSLEKTPIVSLMDLFQETRMIVTLLMYKWTAIAVHTQNKGELAGIATYAPVCCTSVIRKILGRIIARRIYERLIR